jgi:hypothetical protein
VRYLTEEEIQELERKAESQDGSGHALTVDQILATLRRYQDLLAGARATSSRRAKEWAQGIDAVIARFLHWRRELPAFKEDTPISLARHIRRELRELEEHLIRGEDSEAAYECADLIFLACGILDLMGLDPTTVIRNKMQVLKSRRWGTPDEEGVVEHLK